MIKNILWTFDRLCERAKKDSLFKTFYFFKDKYNRLIIAYARSLGNGSIDINVFDEYGESVGSLGIIRHQDRKLFMTQLYCYRKYRGSGVAEKMIELSEYLLSDLTVFYLVGVFDPFELSQDESSPLVSSTNDLRNRVENFYHKMGFFIITPADMDEFDKEYPFLEEDEHIPNSYNEMDCLVVKKLEKKTFSFVQNDELLFDSSALDRIKDIKATLEHKNFTLKKMDSTKNKKDL